METMGEIIKRLRLENGMTQEELGKHIGVQKSAIRKYESGMVENIPRSSIQKMATLFNVRPSYLMGWEDNAKKHTADTANIFTPHEIELIKAYRAQPELQTAVDKVLGVERDGRISLYTAAHSSSKKPDGIVGMGKDEWERIKNASDTDDKLM